MCGIFAIYRSKKSHQQLRKIAISAGVQLRHRGPDWSGIYTNQGHDVGKGGTILAHERLSIIDPRHGDQPIISNDDVDDVIAIVNGEIYNYEELKDQHCRDYQFKTHSDSEIVIPLFLKYGLDFANYLNGMFAIILYCPNDDRMVAVRDHIGIIPLYFGVQGVDGSLVFSSEIKGFENKLDLKATTFPPGHLYDSQTRGLRRWYSTPWLRHPTNIEGDLNRLRDALSDAVIRCTLSDVPWGVLLSGGLDSSLVASIVLRHFKHIKASTNCNEDSESCQIHTFSAGFPDSPDLIAAKSVADFIGSIHHTLTFDLEDALDALPRVIWHMESYNASTIRSAVPQYLMARRIKALGIKMVLTGEGADELFAGYNEVFEPIQDPETFHLTCAGTLSVMQESGICRNNKVPMAFGLETRVPFLDPHFISTAMNYDPVQKLITPERPEKWLLRSSFDSPDDPYLPSEVLWRKKDRFSSGVGKSWVKAVQQYADNEISDSEFSSAPQIYSFNTPKNKEQYLYRKIFHEFFKMHDIEKTVPVSWSASVTEFVERAMEANSTVESLHEEAARKANDVLENSKKYE